MNTLTTIITLTSRLDLMHAANINEKAKSISTRYDAAVCRDEHGYATGGVWFTPLSGYGIGYVVDAEDATCTCTGFENHGICSHLLAAARIVDDARQADEDAAIELAEAEYDAREEGRREYDLLDNDSAYDWFCGGIAN